jgi:hypothetical protein
LQKFTQFKILEMRFNRVLAWAVFFFTIHVSAPAQEMLGTTLGNYAGVNSIQLNPSALHNSKTYLDIQLLGLDLFVQNNYLYMPKSEYRFTNFFKAGYVWPTHNQEYGTEQRIFYNYTNLKNKNAFVQSRINGPGAMLIWGDHAFALSTAVRTVSSMTNVPYELANFIYLGLNYQPQQNRTYTDPGPIKASAMSWGEIGISYSNTFYARGFDLFSAGITVKRLFGLGGMYINARQLDYMVPNDSTIDVKNLYAEMGLSLPVDYNTNAALTSPVFKGGGFGVDLGVTYTRLSHYHQDQYYTSLCAKPYEDYLYRVGVALIDVGGIKFKHNTSKLVIDNRSSYWDDVANMNFSTIDQFLDTLSYKFYGDTTSAWAGDRFTLWLPSALSVQFDYHLRKFWYVNASLIYGFPLSRAAIVRPPELSVTPRYETRWFEVSMPVSLYNWQLLRVGLALRIYGLTIGTDKIGGYFHYSDFTGLDFYMSLKLFFNKGKCRDKGPIHCGSLEPKKIKY